MANKSQPTKAELNKVLNNDVKEQFEIDHTKIKSLKFVSAKHGMIDFKTMTVKRASQLVKEGCPYIKLMPVKKKEDSKK